MSGVTRAGIGLLGLGSTPERPRDAEATVVGVAATDVDAAELGRAAVSSLTPVPSDLHASADYRTRVGATLVERAWTKAVAEALDG